MIGSAGAGLKLTVIAIVGCLVMAVAIPVSFFALISSPPPDPELQCVVSGSLPSRVPDPMNGIFTKAAKEWKIDPIAVALVYYVENGQQYRTPPPPYGDGKPWPSSSAGAIGPFQFLQSTWVAYRGSNPKHPYGDPMDLTDAAYGAAHYLSDMGLKSGATFGQTKYPYGKGTIGGALAEYNSGSIGPGSNNPETRAYVTHAFEEFKRLIAAKSSPKATATRTTADVSTASVNQTSVTAASPRSTAKASAPSSPSLGPDEKDCDVTAVSGNAKQLAKQILANKNINMDVYSDVRKDVEDAAAGRPGTAGAMTSVAILKLIATVGKSHTVTVTAIQSSGTGHCWIGGVPHGPGSPYGPCPFADQHYLGNAVDFGALDGVGLSGRDSRSIAIISITEAVLTSGEFGQSQCGTSPHFKKGFIEFPDSCTHLHFDTKTQASE